MKRWQKLRSKGPVAFLLGWLLVFEFNCSVLLSLVMSLVYSEPFTTLVSKSLYFGFVTGLPAGMLIWYFNEKTYEKYVLGLPSRRARARKARK